MKFASTLAMAAAMSMTVSAPLAAQDGVPGPEQDPFIWLEEARSEQALDWVDQAVVEAVKSELDGLLEA